MEKRLDDITNKNNQTLKRFDNNLKNMMNRPPPQNNKNKSLSPSSASSSSSSSYSDSSFKRDMLKTKEALQSKLRHNN